VKNSSASNGLALFRGDKATLELILLAVGVLVGTVGGVSWSKTKNAANLRAVLGILDYGEQDRVALPLESQLRRTAMGLAQERQELKNQLQAWEQILEMSPIGYLHLGANNQILWCNAQSRTLLKISDWQPERQRVLLDLVRSYELDQAIQQTRNRNVESQLEWQLYPSYTDGPGNPAVALKASLVPMANKEVGVFLENRQVALEFTQVRERWASDLAHELRTPLTSIRLAAETLQTKVEPGATRWLDRMLLEVERLTRLIQDFLDLSNLEESQQISPQLVRVGAIIDQAWQSVEAAARKQQVKLWAEGDMDLEIVVDPGRLTQVAINLFDNAIRYSPAGSTIRLISRATPENLELEVLDSGQGFAPNDLPYVFDRLFRGDRSRQYANDGQAVTAGNGLGLAIVRQIIRAHQGTITAANHPNGGGWIKISLPRNLAPYSRQSP
jgi:two-component system, OmpR family, phosphate regulon sensor histidine kinase PhoR